MASISLRDYHRNLSKLLRQNVTDRVIGHCRHILQTYPRNGETYRLLGQALVASGQWRQAEDILRRVLAIYPDDFTAHESLSEVYNRLKNPDAALWHLERALEIRPDETRLMTDLRRMYREHRNVDLKKLPLTASAAARQYRRSGLHARAVRTIQEALEREPGRTDLRLLMAQTYWEAELYVEAAESAFGVLGDLPYCFDGNRILATLWLQEDRPTDATPYLYNMEQVDPYIALEIVQEEPVPDETFMMEELDFQRIAQQELVASGSDLFGDLDIEDVDEEVLKAAVLDEPDDVGSDDFFAAEIPSDWSDAPSADDDDPLGWMQGESSGVTGILGDEDATTADDDDPLGWMQGESSGVTGILGDEGATAADDDDSLSWLEEDLTVTPDDDDPLAWMNQGGSGLTGMLDDDDDDPLAPGGNPNQWMEQDAVDDPNDPLAWLSGAGGELLGDDEQNEVYDPLAALEADNEDEFRSKISQTNPLAWLGDDYIDPDSVPDDSTGDDNTLAWLEDEDVFRNNSESIETGPLVERSTPNDDTGTPSWLMADEDDALDEMLSMEAFASDDDLDTDWLHEYEAETDSPKEKPDDSGWLNDVDMSSLDTGSTSILGEVDEPDWLAEADLDSVDADEDIPSDWMDEMDATAGDVGDGTQDVPDWMDEVDTGDLSLSDDEAEDALDWMTGLDVSADDADDDPALDVWMSDQVTGELDADALEGDEAEDALDWMTGLDASADDADDDDPALDDWMSDQATGELNTGALEDDEAEGDWLDNLTMEDDSQVDGLDWVNAVDNSVELDDEFELDDPSFDVASDAAAIAEGDSPDWLAEAATDNNETAWMDDPTDTMTEQEGDAMSDELFGGAEDNGDEPDWLSGFDADDDDADDADGQTDWLAGFDDNAEDDLFGGLSEEDEEDEAFGEAPAAEFDFSEFSEEDEDEEDEAFGEAPAAEFDFSEDEASEEAEPDWLTTLGAEDEADDLFGELSEDGEEDEAFGEMPAAEFDFSEDEASEEAEPDWLTTLGSEDEADDLFGELGEDDEDDDEAFGEMPAAEFDFSEDEASEEAEPDWLTTLGAEDEAFGEMPAAEFDFSEDEASEEAEPDWLTTLGTEDEEDDLFGEQDEEDDLFGELGEEDEEDEAFGEAPAAEFDLGEDTDNLFAGAQVPDESPEWLSELDEAGEDEPDEAYMSDDRLDELFGDDDASGVEPEISETPAAQGEPDWLSEVELNDELEEDAEPDWLTSLADEDDADEPDELLEWTEQDDRSPLFSDEEAEQMEEEPQVDYFAASTSNTEPDWLANVGEVEADDTADEEMPAPSWLDAAEPFDEGEVANAQDEAEPVNEFAADTALPDPPEADEFVVDPDDELFDEDEDTAPDWLTYDPDDDLLSEDEEAANAFDLAPVDAAPDWLNAMVPGLDMDFSTDAEEPIETEFVEGGMSYRSRDAADTADGNPTRAFKWLMDIVEQEGESPLASAPRRSRFVFTRPPLWRRRQPSEQDDTSLDELAGDVDVDPAQDEPAWLDDFDDFDQN